MDFFFTRPDNIAFKPSQRQLLRPTLLWSDVFWKLGYDIFFSIEKFSLSKSENHLLQWLSVYMTLSFVS